MRLTVLAALGVALGVTALGGWGTVRPRSEPSYAHVTLFDGAGWTALSLREKELLVEGFLLGAATEQALSGGVAGPAAAPAGQRRAGGPHAAAESARRLAADVARLREASGLRFAYAPGMLARRLDEFYWWRDNRDVPVTGALGAITGRLRTENF